MVATFFLLLSRCPYRLLVSVLALPQLYRSDPVLVMVVLLPSQTQVQHASAVYSGRNHKLLAENLGTMWQGIA